MTTPRIPRPMHQGAALYQLMQSNNSKFHQISMAVKELKALFAYLFTGRCAKNLIEHIKDLNIGAFPPDGINVSILACR